MKTLLKNFFIVLLFASVTTLFADNDTINLMEIYSCDFQDTNENNLWQFKHSSGKNKWTINTNDNDNYRLFVSNNSSDTAYSKTSSSISLAYREIELIASDTLQIEFDVNIGGEGTKDYLKVMVLPKNFNMSFPNSLTSYTGFTAPYYKDSAFVFDDGNVYLSITNGQKHIVSKIKNTFSCSQVYLVFVWRNDNTSGTMPGAIVDNIVLKGVPTLLKDTICEGNTYTFNEKQIMLSGLYCDTLQTENNCDSVVYLQLAVNPIIYTAKDTSICSNQDFVLSDGTNYGKKNVDTVTMLSINYTLFAITGCDSIVLYTLIIYPVNQSVEPIIAEICEGETYLFADNELSKSGEYFDTLQNYYGCDSIIALNLIVNPVYKVDTTVNIIKGESYIVGNNTYTKKGTYIDTLQSINGCDSIVTTKITVSSSIDEVSNIRKTEIFPNPAKNTIVVNLQPIANKRVINIINNFGVVVKTLQIPANQSKISIDLSTLPKGTYVLQIQDGSNVENNKLIVE